MVLFDVGSGEKVDYLLSKIYYFILVESFGVVESLIFVLVCMIYVFILVEWRVEFGIIEGLVCILVGLEDVEDLIEDFWKVFE